MNKSNPNTITLLRKLSYFNLIAGVIFFVIAKSSDSILEPAMLIFPILFNWKVLQDLQIKKFHFNIWHHITGILGIIYALILILYVSRLLNTIDNKQVGIFLGGHNLLFGLSLIVHYTLTLSTKHETNKIKFSNP